MAGLACQVGPRILSELEYISRDRLASATLPAQWYNFATDTCRSAQLSKVESRAPQQPYVSCTTVHPSQSTVVVSWEVGTAVRFCGAARARRSALRRLRADAHARPWRMKFFNFARELEKELCYTAYYLSPTFQDMCRWSTNGFGSEGIMNFCIAELFERDETLLVVAGNYCRCALRKV